MKNKQKIRLTKDNETEPDYGVTLKCIYCDMYHAVSGQWADFNEVDNTNFVCHDCQYLCD